jgi:DNA-binding response OmpR family regulator
MTRAESLVLLPGETRQPPRILIAVRDPSLRSVLHLVLLEGGYQIEQAASLEKALRSVDEHSFDLVLTGLFALPHQSHLAEVVRLQQRCQPTPVGIITGRQVSQEAARQAGFAFLVHKPFRLVDLLQQIAGHLIRNSHPFPTLSDDP